MEKFAVGIDLGTTYSAVAVYRNGNAEIIHNDQGNRITPSCVAFTSAQRIVGEGAAFQAAKNPTNTIYGIKRLMGRKFNDKEIQKDIRSWPFRVMEQKDQIKIEVDYKGERKSFFPEEISAAILENMKNAAEAYLGVKIKDVVITCPAYFNNTQRQATKDAAQIAGLNVLRMINEPTAAAMAFGLSVNRVEEKNVLVFDFGGGTFDVSILKIKNKEFTVRATNGDTHLGGEDFDQRMVEFFVDEFKRKQNRDISNDKGFMRQLKSHCERAKRTLSFTINTEFKLEGTNLSGSITRSRFEEMNFELFEKAINLVQATLKDAKMTKSQIDDVVLVGGSSRIPKIRAMLSDFFDGKVLSQRVNPDEAVALGAAIQAGMLQSDVSIKLKGLKLCDVCPLSLGLELSDGSFCKIIERNTPIPVKASDTFCTSKDNQTSGSVIVYEGEQAKAQDNHFLGQFVVRNIPPKPKGEVSIENTYEIDKNGILQVTAYVPLTGLRESIIITNESRMSKDDANRLVTKGANFLEEDAKEAARLVAYNALVKLVNDMKRYFGAFEESSGQKEVLECADKFLAWVSRNKGATKEELEIMKSKLEKVWNDFSSEMDSSQQKNKQILDPINSR